MRSSICCVSRDAKRRHVLGSNRLVVSGKGRVNSSSNGCLRGETKPHAFVFYGTEKYGSSYSFQFRPASYEQIDS